MIPDLLLEVTPELLLLDWCGPVTFWLQEPTTGADVVREGWWWRGRGFWEEPDGTLCEFVDGSVCLDLARSECRDRVARVSFSTPSACALFAGTLLDGVQRAELWSAGQLRAVSYALEGTRTVEALADLDPYSQDRLPDGSRVVDAQALRAVAQATLQ